jgi:phosphatidate cytidylyltransferase
MSQELTKRILSSLILIPIALFFIIKGSFLFILFLFICFSLIIYEWHMMSKKKYYSIFGYIFLILSFYTIYRLRIDNDYSFLLFVTIICVSTDIGGYIFGKTFKGPKLTKFSPNKTYAGMLGGYLLSILTAIILTNFYFSEKLLIKLLIFVFLISSISQLGDIIISYFKRISNIKDTGKIIPGHGGLLDRVDGMIFAFPFSYLILLTDFL